MRRARAALAAAVLVTITAAVGPPVDATPSAPATPAGRAASAAPRTTEFPGDRFSAYDLGAQLRPPNVRGRDAGVSALVDGKSLWIYGDTVSLNDGRVLTNTGARNVPGFLPTSEPLDSTGYPANQIVPYSTTELNYNAAHVGVSRYWVWPTGIIGRPGTTSLIFWERARATGDNLGDPGTSAIGLADISGDDPVAQRRGALFGPQECSWQSPVLDAAGTTVYLYASPDNDGLRSSCPSSSMAGDDSSAPRFVARAPLAEAGTHDSYEYWTGSTWSGSASAAVAVRLPINPTVSWNESLGRYIAIGGYGNDSYYTTAPSPWGTWNTVRTFLTPITSNVGFGNYAWYDHPEHQGADGGVMLVSYHHSLPGYAGTVQMLAVDTRADPDAGLAAYITETYQEILGRNPTSGALADWAGRLTRRDDSVPSFTRYLARSAEGLRRTVRQTYLEVFGATRPATTTEQDYWAGLMASGGWGHDVLVGKLANAPEFRNPRTDEEFVTDVFDVAVDRAPSQAEIDYWTDYIGLTSYELTARALMRTAEAGRHQAELAYALILGRPATPEEADGVSDVLRDRIEIRIAVAATAEAIGL